MAINFPNSPTNGQIFTSGGKSYEYNSTTGVWNRRPETTSPIPTDVSDLTDTTNVIPADISDLTDTGGVLGTGGATVYADMAALIAATGMSNGDLGLVSANNNVYIYNGSGWYKIATVQNDSPSAITGVNGTYELATDGTATVITAVSTDPEGFPLTWSYSTSGLGSIATVSQADNVFTITPSTDDNNAGTFTLTLNATDGVNGAVSTNTSISLEFVIVNSKYTTLLATATDTGANSTITYDTGLTTGNSLTVNGDAHAGTFSPYRNNYSTYLDGNDNYTVPNGLHLGTGDFTFEFWIWMDEDTTNAVRTFINGETSGTGVGWRFGQDTYAGYNGLTFGYGLYGSYTVGKYVNNYWLPNGEWTHLAAQRRSGTIEIYINGVSQTLTTYNENGTFSDGANLTSTQTSRTFFSNVKGYVADLRLVTGSYVYDGNFTPSTENITAVTNTALLTNQNQFPYLVDNSPNAYAITVNGNTSIKPFSRHDTNKYSENDNGGSVYFDGTGDYLTLGTGVATAPSGDFTAEAWVYITSNAATSTVFDFGADADYGVRVVWSHTPSHFRMYASGGIVYIFNNSNTHPINQWYHVAAVRDQGMFKFYVNGVLQGTSTVSVTFTQARFDAARVGATSHTPTAYDPSTGYISDFRYNPTTAIYTATDERANVPTSPLSSTGADVHIKGTDASIIDKSQSTNLQLVGNTTGSTTQVKFAGSKSMYFDGSGDYLLINKDTPNINTLDKDFTIEFWLYDTSPTTWKYVAAKADSSGNTANTEMMLGTGQFSAQTDGKLYYTNSLGAYLTYTNSALSANTWYHVAVVRNQNLFKMYLDGVAQTATTTNTGSIIVMDEDLVLGGHQYQVSTLGRLNGYIQDFRFTNGLARYTSNFTVPSAPLKG